METSREDVSIAIRSAFLRKGTQQRFSLFALAVVSVIFLFVDNLDTKPLNYLRSFVKDVIYRTSVVASMPLDGTSFIIDGTKSHFNLKSDYENRTNDHHPEITISAMDKVSSGTDKITVSISNGSGGMTWRKSGSVDWVTWEDDLLIDGTADTDPLVPVDTDIELGNSANPDHAMILENESNLPVTLILTFTDQAGNENPFPVPQFTIDRTKPEILTWTVTGLTQELK